MRGTLSRAARYAGHRSTDVSAAGRAIDLPAAGRVAALWGIFLLAFAGPAAAQGYDQLSDDVQQMVAVPAPVVAITDVTVIDGTGAPPMPGRTVVLADGRIAGVGTAGEVEIPEGAEVIDGTGHTLIPGLVGLHNHMFYMAAGGRSTQAAFTSPRLYLGAGVTTIRTTGSASPYSDINTKAAISDGRVPGPRIHITAPYITGSGPGGGADMAEITSPEQARAFVAYWASEGATWVKAYTDITRENLAAAIDEAHAHDMKVTGHLCSVTFREAVELGIDNLEHGFDTATDFLPGKRLDECPSNAMVTIGREAEPAGETAMEVIDTLVDAGVGMTSTLAVIEPFIPGRPTKEPRTLEAMAPEVREDYLEAREQIDNAENFPFTEAHLKKAMEFERAFVEAGGLLAAGVDPTGVGGAIAGFGDQRNYQLFVEAGFTPEQAIRIMSLNGAKILGVDDELGSVEEGKLADVVLLEGALASDPAVIEKVAVVWKDGVGYDSAKLIEAVQGRVGID